MRKYLLCLLAVSVTACGSGSGSNNDPQGPQIQPPAGTIPDQPAIAYAGYGKLSEAELQLVGPDSNANGVRDDVDASITKTFSVPAEQQRMVTYAQWLTWTTVRGVRGTATSSEELTRFGNAVACAAQTQYSRLGEKATYATELQGQVLNTIARTRAYLAWDASTDGMPSKSAIQPCGSLKDVTTP